MHRNIISVMTVFLLSFFTLVSGMAETPEVKIVENGKVLEGFIIGGKDWKNGKDCVTIGSPGLWLMSKSKFASPSFEVKIVMSLEKLEGTAAVFHANNHMLGFDGGPERRIFYETASPTVYWGKASDYITPGKPFTFVVKGLEGKMEYFIDGKKIGDATYTNSRSLFFGLRPHRNHINVMDFTIKGIPTSGNTQLYDMFNGISTEFSVIAMPLDINKKQEIELRDTDKITDSQYEVKLIPRGSQTAAATASLRIAKGKITLPSEFLKRAYAGKNTTANTAAFVLNIGDKNNPLLQNTIILYDGIAATDFPVSKIAEINGKNTLTFNGKPEGTINAMFGQYLTARISGKSLRQFHESGVNGVLLSVHPARFYRDGKFDYEAFVNDLNRSLSYMTAENPDALFHLHWSLEMPSLWSKEHPAELIRLDNGLEKLQNGPDGFLQPSYASALWRQVAGEMLEDALTKLRHSPFADRIVTLRLLYGNCGEWNHWGYHEQAFVDYSLPMQRAFGAWLKNKYATKEKLQSAWNKTTVTLDSSDLVPVKVERMREKGHIMRLNGSEGQSTVDYYTFFQEFAPKTIEYFAKIAKTASENRLAVGSYYGYYVGHYGSSPYHFQDSGSYGLKYFLASPYLDFLGGPYPYQDRLINLELNGVFSSIKLHGKLWQSEGDQRTHNSDASNKAYGVPADLSESIAIAKRDYMLNLSRGASYYFFDFVNNWYLDAPFIETVKTLKRIDDFSTQVPRRTQAEVAVLLSEETVPYLSNLPGGVFEEFKKMLWAENQLWGVPFDNYLVSDIDKIDFSPYKVVIFANSLYASDETIKMAREKVCRNNRTVIYYLAPGVINEKNQIDEVRSEQFTGIQIKAFPNEYLTRISLVKSPAIRQNGCGMKFRTVITDKNGETIAKYPDGQSGGFLRKFDDHTAIILCLPAPNAQFIRPLLEQSGIKVLPQSSLESDRWFFAGAFTGIYSRTGGLKKLDLPGTVEIAVDLFTGKILGENTSHLEFTMPEKLPDTVIIFAGSKADYRKYRSASSK